MSRAQPVQVARSACVGHLHNTQVVGVCRDLSPLPSPRPGRDILSRSRPPRRLSQVATSIPCRDLSSAQPNHPGHDLKNGVATPISIGQVATSNRCRDQPLLLPQKRPCRNPKPWSRHQTITRQPEPCRDINSMSRHHGQCLLLRRQNRSRLPSLVSTSRPAKPGRDLIPMSRPQEVLTHNELFFYFFNIL